MRIENGLFKNANFFRDVWRYCVFLERPQFASWLVLVITKQRRLLSFLADTCLRGPSMEAAIGRGKLCRKSASSFAGAVLFVCLSSLCMSCSEDSKPKVRPRSRGSGHWDFHHDNKKCFCSVFIFLSKFVGTAVRSLHLSLSLVRSWNVFLRVATTAGSLC